MAGQAVGTVGPMSDGYPPPTPTAPGFGGWWASITPSRRRWFIAAMAVIAVVALGGVVGALTRHDEASAAERDAYTECVRSAEDAMVFAEEFRAEPFEDAEVAPSPDGLRVDVHIDATVDGQDASGDWSCGISDDGELVGIDAPEI